MRTMTSRASAAPRPRPCVRIPGAPARPSHRGCLVGTGLKGGVHAETRRRDRGPIPPSKRACRVFAPARCTSGLDGEPVCLSGGGSAPMRRDVRGSERDRAAWATVRGFAGTVFFDDLEFLATPQTLVRTSAPRLTRIIEAGNPRGGCPAGARLWRTRAQPRAGA